MKQRIISGTFCVVVLAIILCFYQTLVLEAALCVLSAVAVYELLCADGFREHKFFLYAGIITAALMPYASCLNLQGVLIALFLIAVILLVLRFHNKIGFEKVSFLIIATLGVSLSFLCIVLLRNEFVKNGLIYILIIFGGAWFSDTGAYFTGRFFGKHKLSPQISPKKTIEGAIGGIVTNVLLVDLMAFIYARVCSVSGADVSVNYIELSLLAVCVAFAGMAGDLIASVIKRQIGIKDYGNVIPGHGGIMDRFDSILFTAPTVYLVTRVFTVII